MFKSKRLDVFKKYHLFYYLNFYKYIIFPFKHCIITLKLKKPQSNKKYLKNKMILDIFIKILKSIIVIQFIKRTLESF